MIQEAQDLISALERLLQQFVTLGKGLSAEALDWKPGPETNSPAAILTHAIGASQHWLVAYVGNRPNDRDRDAEFRAGGGEVSDLPQRVERCLSAIRQVLQPITTAQLDAPCAALAQQQGPYQGFTNREAILHVIEHLGTHVGHLELTLQLWQMQAAPTAR